MFCGIVLLAACASMNTEGRDVSEIRVERNCNGCPTGTVLVLTRSGSATFTQTGNARFGTHDSTKTAAVAAEDFDKLAAFIVSHDFFALNEEYANPETQDGRWTTIAVTRNGVTKSVTRRNRAGPDNLAEIERAINAVAQKIAIAPGA